MPSDNNANKDDKLTPAEQSAAGASRQFAMALELPFILVAAIVAGRPGRLFPGQLAAHQALPDAGLRFPRLLWRLARRPPPRLQVMTMVDSVPIFPPISNPNPGFPRSRFCSARSPLFRSPISTAGAGASAFSSVRRSRGSIFAGSNRASTRSPKPPPRKPTRKKPLFPLPHISKRCSATG